METRGPTGEVIPADRFRGPSVTSIRCPLQISAAASSVGAGPPGPLVSEPRDTRRTPPNRTPATAGAGPGTHLTTGVKHDRTIAPVGRAQLPPEPVS